MKKRIDLYPVPHVEVRIHVSEKMVEDYEKCKRIAGNSDFEECAECNECSWYCTMYQGITACELVTLEQVLGEGL